MGESNMILAADIGGTKTVLGVFSQEFRPKKPILEAKFPSQEYASLEDIIHEFLKDEDIRLTGASIGVAGPVVGDRAQVTNLPWVVESQSLSRALNGTPVQLLNDLSAIAHAIPFLEADDIATINAAEASQGGAKAVIAPGTGLGEGFLVWEGTRYRAFPSEGGHADFAPNNKLQDELLVYLRQRYDHVSCERVCSGKGIPDLYAFFKDRGRLSEPEWLRRELSEAKDKTPVIVNSAIEQGIEISMAATDLFISILGSEAGNMTLKVLATGGVYLAGGIPPRILPQLKSGAFMESFIHKGRFSDFLKNVPVHVILNPNVGLMGAACHGLDL